jgi:O-antigen biosynthesis protein
MDRRMSLARPTTSPVLADAPVTAGRCDLLDDGRLVGFVFDPEHPDRRFTVEVLLDGLVVATAYADKFMTDLYEQGIGNGCYGYVVDLEPKLLATACKLQVRLANLGTKIGNPVDLALISETKLSVPLTAELRWLGGLRFWGWVDRPVEASLDAIVDGEIISQVRANRWTRVEEKDAIAAGRNVRAFDFHLPQRFADGCVHKLQLRHPDGEVLPASSTFVAFPDGLAQTLAALGGYQSEQLRGKLYDQVIPSSLPFADYAQWRDRFPLPSAPASELELAVVIVGSAGAEQTLATLETQSEVRWTAGVIDGPALALDPILLGDFLEHSAPTEDLLVFMMGGMQLNHEHALARIADAFHNHPEAHALYCDLDYLGEDGQFWPVAFPSFDYERMIEQGYCAYMFALRREVAIEALRSDPHNLYRLFNTMFDRDGPKGRSILHLPGSLATLPKLEIKDAAAQLHSAASLHLRARRVEAEIEAGVGALFPAIWVKRTQPPLTTTVVIPTRDSLSLLRTCIETIRPAVERSSAEILVVDNDSADPDTLDYLAQADSHNLKVLRVQGPFNFARLNNWAAATLKSDVLCLLNNDIEARSDDWLEEMLSRLAESDVGAVGALLSFPGGVVQHGGVVLGVNFGAAHAFTDRLIDDMGYLDLLRVAHECSAVTAACLVTRRTDYLQVGGMDEAHFGVAFNDVDFCLRLREKGKRVVFTPHAHLVHAESATRGQDDRPDKRDRFQRELAMLRARWGEYLLNDPTYNPLLSRDGIPYRALAWPPGQMGPRLHDTPRARHLPPGF